MISEWRHGAHVVLMQRRSRAGESGLKRISAHLFYRLLKRLCRTEIPADTGDFRLMSRSVVKTLKQLPEWNRFMKGLFAWVSGFFLTALFVLPWYLAAEYKTPGFINYFIVGEHFMRFVDPGWSGDLYGTAHQHAFGTIWLYWIVATFPWGIVAFVLFVRRRINSGLRKSISGWHSSDEKRLLLLSVFFPSLFFTFSGNILWTYQLPALAPFSILLATRITNTLSATVLKKTGLVFTAACVPLLGALVGVTVSFYPEKLKTEKQLVAYYNQHKDEHSQPLMYLGKPPFSAQFYSKGQVKGMALPEARVLMSRSPSPSVSGCFVAVRNGNVDEVSLGLSGRSKRVFSNRRFTLLQVTPSRQRTSRNELERNIAQ